MRTHKLGRWNWSDKAQKWVYVEKKEGNRTYRYSTKPPEEFNKLTEKLEELNKNLNSEKDPKKRNKIFKKMMALSKKMQNMRK